MDCHIDVAISPPFVQPPSSESTTADSIPSSSPWSSIGGVSPACSTSGHSAPSTPFASSDMEVVARASFIKLLNDSAVNEFLQTFILADNFLVAITFCYFQRAALQPPEYTPCAFFVAFHLAVSMYEERELYERMVVSLAYPVCKHPSASFIEKQAFFSHCVTNIRLSLWAMKYDLPQEAKGIIVAATEEGVPITFQGTLIWADDEHTTQPPAALAIGARRTATFFCSFLHHWQQWAKISGDTAVLELDDFMLPASEEGTKFIITDDRPHPSWNKIELKSETITVPGCVQEAKMWENFASVIQGEGDSLFWMRVALATQLCLDAVLESARNGGVSVKVDPNNLMAAYSS